MTISESELIVANAHLTEAIHKPRLVGVTPPHYPVIAIWSDGETYQWWGEN